MVISRDSKGEIVPHKNLKRKDLVIVGKAVCQGSSVSEFVVVQAGADEGEGVFSIYTKYSWELNDRIIHYRAYRNEEETNYAGKFYIYKKEYADKLIKTNENRF